MTVSKKIIQFVQSFWGTLEQSVTLRLCAIEYSQKHQHEICVLQLVGKNSFPKMTPAQILADKEARRGLGQDDLIQIVLLNEYIQQRKKALKVLEIDPNGSIVLRDTAGKLCRYSERDVSNNPDMVQALSSTDAHNLGYRVGFRDGMSAMTEKEQLARAGKRQLFTLVPQLLKRK